MGLFGLFKNRKSEPVSGSSKSETGTCPEAVPKKSLLCTLPHDLTEVSELLIQHGCDILADETEIKMAYDTSWYSEYRIIKADGIYLYREVNMSCYVLEKRLDCSDTSVSFALLCADLLLGMQHRKMIDETENDYQRIIQILSQYAALAEYSICPELQTNFLTQQFIRLIHN